MIQLLFIYLLLFVCSFVRSFVRLFVCLWVFGSCFVVWLFSSLAIILLSKRNMFALLHFICVVLSVLCVSWSGQQSVIIGFPVHTQLF